MNTLALKGKKLLLLGTNMATCDMVNYAKSKGVHTIVSDYLDPENSPAKRIADEYWMISTDDIDLLEKKARENQVNGVIAGISDFNLKKALILCEKLDLPFYCTRDQMDVCSDKKRFKQLCRKHGVPVVPEYSIDENFKPEELRKIEYPVIVKPVDNTAGRGISICNNEYELHAAYEKAKSFSESKDIIIEPYMHSNEVTMFYAIQEGNIYLTAMLDRYTNNRHGQIIPLPVAYFFPSIHLKTYQETLDNNVIEMFKSIGIRNGTIFIQSFIENGEFKFYEMGLRLAATQEYHILASESQINTMEMIVNYALTKKMSEVDIAEYVNPNFKQVYCIINFLVKPGDIGKIVGTNEVVKFPEVITAVNEYKNGTLIPPSALGTLQQIVFRVFAGTATRTELAAVVDRMYNTVGIFSENGDDILLPNFNTKELFNQEVLAKNE